MLFSFTISKSNFITYTIPFYNSTHIKKLYSFIFSIKYYFLIFLYYIFFIVTFFQIPTVTFSQALDLCFFFPDLHSPTVLNFVFFFPVLHSPIVTFFMGYATPFISNGDVDSNGLSLAFIIYFQQSFGLYHLFPTIFCFFKLNNYSKQPANFFFFLKNLQNFFRKNMPNINILKTCKL